MRRDNVIKEVVIVDDCADQRLLVRLALEQIAPGLSIHDYSRAQDCLDAIASESIRPGLVLLDLHMPGIDGAAAAVALRQLPQLDAAVRIVMMSSSDSIDDVRRAYAAGVSSFVDKFPGPNDQVWKLGAVMTYWLQVDQAWLA